MKALYKYPQAEYPYSRLVEENRRRTRGDPEFELLDTGIFDGNRYFDIFVEYAKAAPDDIFVRITAANRGPESAPLHILPTLWFRNTWSWGRTGEGYWPRPRIAAEGENTLIAEHASLGKYRLEVEPGAELLLTENETNILRLFNFASAESVRQGCLSRIRGPRPPRRRESELHRDQSRRPFQHARTGRWQRDAQAAPGGRG